VDTHRVRISSQYMTPVLVGCISLMSVIESTAEPFPIENGDRIVMVGSTFIERDVRYGCIETLITSHFHDYELTFRNLGWSGDDVFGIARASFDPIPKGYERLINQIKDAAPTVLLISYGHNESFKGKEGLGAFLDGYAKLLDDVASLKAKIVLISPTLQEDMGSPLPNPAEHNSHARLYANAIADLAEERNLLYIDMIAALSFPTDHPKAHWTDNGVHYTEAGYWIVASTILESLGYSAPPPNIEQLTPIRRVINEKNKLFFLKWRPQNATYITGFRKHEQGRHAVEIPLFDPLVHEQEQRISALRIALSRERTGK